MKTLLIALITFGISGLLQANELAAMGQSNNCAYGELLKKLNNDEKNEVNTILERAFHKMKPKLMADGVDKNLINSINDNSEACISDASLNHLIQVSAEEKTSGKSHMYSTQYKKLRNQLVIDRVQSR